MSRYAGPDNFRHDAQAVTGILLTNLGTPEAPTKAAVRRYLAEFLWDPRVVEVPRPLWWLILHGVILRTRPRESAKAYAKVWSSDGSPLLVHTRRQAEALTKRLAPAYPDGLHIEVGMRYGVPSIESALQKLQAANATRLLVLPLYPQYSGTTTGSTFDEVSRQLRRYRRVPALRFIDSYHDEKGYIDALASSIAERGRHYTDKTRLLMSFHGIPRRYLLTGDPYHCLCQKTARLVAAKLQLTEGTWDIAFQSRLGREEWLRPYTDHILADWAAAGVEEVDVVCPGFAADCLETLEEVLLRYRELFIEKGGRDLTYIPALNERADHIAFLADLIGSATPDWRGIATPETDRAGSLQRARQLGAAS